MMMKHRNWIGIIFLSMAFLPAYAFDSTDEQIDHYLELLAADNTSAKVHMLKRLKWRGLSDPRLYDEIAKAPASQYLAKKFDKPTLVDLGLKIRALGYSGNPKYQPTLVTILNDAPNKRLRGYAKKALVDLDRFINWNQKIADSEVQVEGKSSEIMTYFKMLNTEDLALQRFAAEAIFDSNVQDSELLDAVAEKLKPMYSKHGLDNRAMDTAAWFIKVLGGNGGYRELLTEVNQNTPHKKLKKYSIRYIQ